MIAIYTQDQTFIKNNADAAKDTLISVYGQKLGTEAYETMKNGREGIAYRKNGGPLVQCVSAEKAAWIREKETAIGMI